MATVPPTRKNPRVALVEDDDTLALLLRYNLEAAGCAVAWFDRGDDAAKRIISDPPDLVILDWSVPGLAGIEVLRRIRADARTRLLPVAMLTARTDPADRHRAESHGADAYILKPFSVREAMMELLRLLRPRGRAEAEPALQSEA